MQDEHAYVQQVEHSALLERGEGMQAPAGCVGQLPQPTLSLAGDRSMFACGGQLGAVTLQRVTFGLQLADGRGELGAAQAAFRPSAAAPVMARSSVSMRRLSAVSWSPSTLPCVVRSLR